MKRFVSAILIAAASVAVPGIAAAGQHATTTEYRVRVTTHRVYDPYRRDYHVWNRSEQAAYRAYLAERHRSYIAYERQREAQHRAYWRWRHEREERLEHERR